MYLLDTHAFIWFLNDDAKMPEAVKETIMRSEQLYISIGSFWEMTIKVSLGKLKLPAPISVLMNACKEMHITILPITGSHLECLEGLPAFHGDPFDRLIISQAITEKLSLISADSKFSAYNIRLFWR